MGTGNRAKGGRPKRKSMKAKSVNLSSKRRLSRMGKMQIAGKAGIAAHYVSRAKALRMLQVTLRDFRRLCILKGIYPRDPKKKPNKDKNKTYYHLKDISYLAHEPLLKKFWEFKSFMKKVRKRIGKNDHSDAIRMYEGRPEYTLSHLVKERYPSFQDSLEDLDDALCLIHLFAGLPSVGSIRVERTEACLKIAKEWQLYIVKSKSLRKVFCSVKGMYYQARIQGVEVTWLVPHKFAQNLPNDVDYRVMLTFLEFYETSLRFVMFKLYHNIGIRYPPKILQQTEEEGAHLEALQVAAIRNKAPQPLNLSKAAFETDTAHASTAKGQKKSQPVKVSEEKIKSLQKKLKNIENEPKSKNQESEGKSQESSSTEEQEQMVTKEQSLLLSGMKFYIAREVPFETLQLCILSFGGRVIADENDESITHQVTDRTILPTQLKSSRDYIQPQWVFDSINAEMLLPITRYHPHSKDLPPHLSPFVDNAAEGYTPLYAEELKKLRTARDANTAPRSLIPDNTPGLESLLQRNNEIESQSDASESENESENQEQKLEDQEQMEVSEEESKEEVEEKSRPKDERKKKEAAEGNAAKDFLSSRKFQGAKTGYVFRKGKSGVGYYIDTNKNRKVTFVKGKQMSKRAQRKANKEEAHKRGEMMMSKKAKRLYGRMQHGINKKKEQVDLLKRKREQHTRKSKKQRGRA